MDWSRVKTLLIAVLLLVDCVLGGVWLARSIGASAREREAAKELCSLLAMKNILALPEQIGDERAYSYHWERSRMQEAAAAALLLETVWEQSVGDTVTLYESDKGRAEFRMNGGLSITAHAMPADTLELMRRMGFDAGRGNVTEGYTQLLEGLPIFRNVVRLTPGKELLITGRWFWGSALPVSAELCHTAGYCLLALAEALNSNVPLTLEDCVLGFLETQIDMDTILLTPYWRVSLSSQIYYVNAISAEWER